MILCLGLFFLGLDVQLLFNERQLFEMEGRQLAMGSLISCLCWRRFFGRHRHSRLLGDTCRCGRNKSGHRPPVTSARQMDLFPLIDPCWPPAETRRHPSRRRRETTRHKKKPENKSQANNGNKLNRVMDAERLRTLRSVVGILDGSADHSGIVGRVDAGVDLSGRGQHEARPVPFAGLLFKVTEKTCITPTIGGHGCRKSRHQMHHLHHLKHGHQRQPPLPHHRRRGSHRRLPEGCRKAVIPPRTHRTAR